MSRDPGETEGVQEDWERVRQRLIADPDTSEWLRAALCGIGARDAFELANDGAILAAVLLGRHCEERWGDPLSTEPLE